MINLNNSANAQLLMVSADDLKEVVMAWCAEFTNQERAKAEAERNADRYLTGSQVCKMLNVGRTTLWRWAKEGYLVPELVHGKNRYKYSKINKMMEVPA